LNRTDLTGANARCRPEHHWEFAKWVAVICMALNHIGLVLPAPWPEIGVAFGRTSLPIFSLLIVFPLQRDIEARAGRYLGLLLFWGLLTQPVFALLFANWAPWCGNAMLTLASGVCLIYLAASYGVALAGLAAVILMGAPAWLDSGAHLDGGAWMPVAPMNVAAHHWVSIPPLVALLGTPLLVLASPHLSGYLPRLPQLAFYSFYPLHLAAILALHGAY
jgi:TraX protein